MSAPTTVDTILARTSVVIAMKDDPRIIECLRSVDEPVEVVLCLNGSPSWVRPLIEQVAPKAVLTEIPKAGNLGLSYNTAIEAASGRYLLLMDSDCTFEPGAIRAMAARVGQAFVVKGVVVYGEAHGRMSELTARLREFDEGDFVSAQSPPLIYDRQIVDNIGGYHFDPLIHWCEDREFDFRVQMAGIPVEFLPEGRIHHDSQAGFSNLRSYWRYGIGEGIGQEIGVFTTPAVPVLWRTADSARSIGECLLRKGLGTALYYALTLAIFHSAGVYHRFADPYRVRSAYPPSARRLRMLGPIRQHGTELSPQQRRRLAAAHTAAGHPIRPIPAIATPAR